MKKNRPTDPNFFQQGTVNTRIFFLPYLSQINKSALAVFIAHIIIKLYNKARLISGPSYKHTNHNSSVGVTFTFNFDLMIESPIFLCLLYAIVGVVENKSLHT